MRQERTRKKSGAILESNADNRICPSLHVRCKGAECMAWRWMDDTESDLGYCGLAGWPHAGIFVEESA